MFSWFENRIAVFRDVPLPPGARSLTGFVLHFVRQIPLRLLAVAVLSGATAILQALVFVFIGQAVNVVDAAVRGGTTDNNIDTLVYQVPAVLLLLLVINVLSALSSNQMVQTRFTPLIRWQNHIRVVRQSMGFFHADFAGRIASQVMETGQSLQNTVIQTIALVCGLAIFLVSVGVIFAGLYWVFLVPVALWLVACLWTLKVLLPRVMSRARENADARAALMGRIVDAYSNIMTVKLFAGPAREDESIRTASRLLVDKASLSMRMTTLLTVLYQAFNIALMIGTFLIAIWQWRLGALPIGGVVIASTLAFQLQNLSWGIMNNLVQVTTNVGTVQNGMKTIAEPLSLRPIGKGRLPPPAGPEIVLRGVRFTYGGKKPALEDVSLSVAASEKIGVVGPSGAGKSTLVGLVAGLYLPEAGTVAIGGCLTTELSEDELRELFSVVSQDVSLFNRSVRENILYGRPDASEERIASALAKAKADEFINDLVDKQGRRGLDALVGERGVRLSAGQRQRISITRAIVKDAPILLLDEASSALDSATEEHIQAELAVLMRDKTVIVVAHRLSTLTRMDRIAVMDKGRVVATGSHQALLAAEGIYRDLWRLQARGAAMA